ncbi:hypothetical protein NBG4_160011 [Candidatus Sulfobium mesophilum]|uniref:Uncharacterized protein n=1 Tax=Candidatus Sulfobium mesophilum TaxID=2016548 RepID=A0A2U3QF46_9BACT|nr:hypothetical protein NBG4_160011 [Candidatus Sulfobium mesophilum]
MENEVHPAPDPFDHPQNLLVGIVSSSLAHGEAVKKTGFAMLSSKRGF